MNFDILSIEWKLLLYSWQERVVELTRTHGDFNHGLLHAYQGAMRRIDENAMMESPLELEIQTKELLSYCEREGVNGFSEYGRGYAEGNKQCAYALKKLIAETVG